MTDEEFVRKERYLYEIENHLCISRYKLREILSLLDLNVPKGWRKLPPSALKTILDFYKN